jgi:trehalose synthase
VDCRLVYCYNVAIDDPESMQIYERVYAKAKRLVDKGDVLFVLGNNEVLVNAIQRRAAVVVQNSSREGFCLAVTEALWKSRPVVATQVGGIPLQIRDGETGFLVPWGDRDAMAERITRLLQDAELARAMGEAARETVRQRFLVTRLLLDYLGIIGDLVS